MGPEVGVYCMRTPYPMTGSFNHKRTCEHDVLQGPTPPKQQFQEALKIKQCLYMMGNKKILYAHTNVVHNP